MARVGLIAGQGDLPSIWARAARDRGEGVHAFPLFKKAGDNLKGFVEQISEINLGALDNLIRALHVNGIKEVVMIGKVEKTLLFGNLRPDRRMEKLLQGLKELNDDNIMGAVVAELAAEGIEVIKQSTYLEDLLPEEGLLTSGEVGESLIQDMQYGFKMAREIGRLDIGQTVVVKRRAVLAVEAIEGTDEAIIRGGQLGGPGVVVAKVSKPQQDWRFDLPTVGWTTLARLLEVEARGLVIEAGGTFLLEKERLIREAEEHGLAVVAMSASELD